MKIAHVTATFPPYHGGTGTVCYYNALHLARLGHDVTIFTADYPPGSGDYPPEITVKRLPVSFRIGNAPFLPGLMNIRGFDVIHLHWPFVFGAEMLFLRYLAGRNHYIITYHQDLILNGLTGQLVKLHHSLLGKLILKRARRLCVTSIDYANASRIEPVVRQLKDHVVEMPNGVDANRFHPDADAQNLREHYGLASSDQLILFVGGLDRAHYFKGVDVLLNALAILNDANVKLLIVGDGDLKSEYEALANEFGIDEHVIFCGRVSDDLLPAHYRLCDFLVLPSTTMGEAFGVVLLEAMASAKPVIASNLPGVRSVVADGDDGLLATVDDADDLAQQMQTLLENPQLRHEMGQNGRKKVETHYAWERIAPQLEDVYRQVIADVR